MKSLEDLYNGFNKLNDSIKVGIYFSTIWIIFASISYIIIKNIFLSSTYNITLRNGSGNGNSKIILLTPNSDFFSLVIKPILIIWFIFGVFFWMKKNNLFKKIKNISKPLFRQITKLFKNTKIQGISIIILGYLLFYSYINNLLSINNNVFTILIILFKALFNKTLWIFIFLFWFGLNLLSILKSWVNKQQ
jgi:hypothetical protein